MRHAMDIIKKQDISSNTYITLMQNVFYLSKVDRRTKHNT